MPTPLEVVLADDFLGDVGQASMTDLRDRRGRCTEVETGLSYLRRMAQGRLDVVAAEQARRAEGGGGADLEELIGRLPAQLAGSTRSPGVGRLPHDFGTGLLDEGLVDRLDDITSAAHLDAPDTLDDETLARAVEDLAAFERDVSSLRRAIFDRLDVIETEVARRYKTGEASVDTLLHGPA